MEVLRGVRASRVALKSVNVHYLLKVSGDRAARKVLAGVALCVTAVTPFAARAQLPGAIPHSVKWPIRTREQVDLWLHGFAMISGDSSTVPLFRRGYREMVSAARTKAGAVTDLDVNRDALAKRLRENPTLVNAQFLVFSFATWEELVAGVDTFEKADGDPKRAKTKESAAMIAALARIFPAKADRDFARMFTNSLQNEKDVFFHTWWVDEMRRRERTLASVDAIWQSEMRPRLQGFMTHSEQADGELILSLAIEGEGRTVNDPRGRSQVTVGFPDSPERAMDAIYTFAHEIVGPLTGPAVDDNTTPAEKRSGLATTIGSYALVRGGALVFAHLSPELTTGYERFYLRLAGITAEGDPTAAFGQKFSIPAAMVESIARQVSISFGGI
jgi:hypothetical protein